ncbi:DoxX family protein [Sphingomonas sp. NPDC092331]|jgi:DoxX-like family|uniref:DoxX family protein n=1 Tax=unclassified Sphingomonas TaxID=196159 RepID=UPI0031F48C45
MKRDLAIGWALSGLVILFLAMDAGGKLIAPAAMIAYSPPLGIPPDVNLYRELGLILAIGTILYAVPRTAVLGAILLTGYLGGAVAMHFRVGSPLFSHTLFGVYLGVLAWGGLWFRDPRVRALIPIAG